MSGFTFAGVHSATRHVRLLRSPVSILPGTRDKVISIPGRHGSFRALPDLGERQLQLECWLAANTTSELYSRLELVRSWLNPLQGAQQLLFDNIPNRFYLAAYAGNSLDAEITANQGFFTLNFVCADPFLYNSLEREFNFANSINLTNIGTHPCDPIFRFTFTAAASELRIALAGRQIRIVHNFLVGNVLDVNCVTGGVLIAGARAMDRLDWQNSEFFSLAPGLNAIALTPVNVCSANVRYRERWL